MIGIVLGKHHGRENSGGGGACPGAGAGTALRAQHNRDSGIRLVQENAWRTGRRGEHGPDALDMDGFEDVNLGKGRDF